MERVSNDNLRGLSSIAAAFTAGNSSTLESEDGGAFDLLFKQVTTTLDRPERPAEDVNRAERPEPDNRAAEEPKAAAESNEDEPSLDESQPADEAASEVSDPPEQSREPDQGQGREEKEDQKAEADAADGTETSETEDNPGQKITGEEDENIQVQAQGRTPEVLVEAVAQQVEGDEANAGKVSAEEESPRPERRNEVVGKTERRDGTAAKIEVSAQASGESNGEEGESAKEKDAPLVELAGEESEEATVKLPKNAGEKNPRQEAAAVATSQSGNPTESGEQPGGMEPVAAGLKAPRADERPSGRERRQTADQAAVIETSSDANPVAKTQVAPNPAAEILAAVTDPAKSATDDGAAENVESGPKPVAGLVNQGETGQPTRGASDQGPRVAGAGEAAPSSEGDPIDRVRFVQRVARAFDAASSRGDSIRMRLHPAELGSLRLEITVRDGVMTARMETETQTARNLLLDNLPVLRERLAQQEIKVQQFDIDLMDNSTGGSPRGPEDESFSQDRSGRQGSNTAAEQAVEPEEAAGPRPVTRPGEGTHLNVVI